MIAIHLDGERMEVTDKSTLGAIIPHHPPGCSVAIIRPSTQEQAKTGTLAISTTAGEIAIEISEGGEEFLKFPEIVQKLALHWEDRYATAFGP
ncbi:MAG: methanogenesis marker 3 protein, partial [Methanoregula sp.]|nr:methanogenesis marker 3 protein [Methanoregula sp.]